MKINKNKTTAVSIAIILILSISASMTVLPNANAHTPAWQIPTYAYIFASPNPVGVGQSVHVDMWLDKVLPGAELPNDIRFQNFKLTITAPDGTVTTQSWPVVTDPTANQIYSFTPTQTGTYNLTFTYLGQVYTWTEIPDFFGNLVPTDFTGDTYLPSNASTTLTVQSTPIATISAVPLPTDYWTRPIYGENTNWYTISSNWLGIYAPGYQSTYVSTSMSMGENIAIPGAVGPLTGHIMWTKPLQSGGVVGGTNFQIAGDTYWDGSAYSLRYNNPIIMDGKLYYTEPLGYNAPAGGPTVCVDLRTGQQIWSSTTMPPPTFGYIYDVQDPNQHGVGMPILISQSGGAGFGGPPTPITWLGYDAYTGTFLFNVTNIPAGATSMGPNGEYLSYVLTNYGSDAEPNWYLAQWNSSNLWAGEYSGPSTTPSNAPPIDDGSNPLCYDWNISIPSLNTLTTEETPTILEAYYGNMLLCMNGTFPGFETAFSPITSFAPYTYFAINLNSSVNAVGSILWRHTLDAPPGNITVSFNEADPTADGGKGVFTEQYKETMQFVGYSMATGQKLWGPIGYDTQSLAIYNEGIPCAYGKLYQLGYGGVIYCYDLTNGNLLWTYGNGGTGNSTNTNLASTFPYYPSVVYAIGSGVLYTVASEHDVLTPIYKGALSRAINATTGQEIWTLSADDNGLDVGNPGGAIADGFATFFNAYDSQIYVVGRGSSATTVSVPHAGLSFGQSVVISGSVIDTSAGTTQTEQKADFPNGVPVASDANMKDWMGYVYQQQPEPTNFTGVQVQLAVLDSNGNQYSIGTAVTDQSGTYSLTWTPIISGNYTVYATFAGTNGYWPSYAEDHFTVMQEPQATAAPTPTPVSAVETYFAPAVIAIVLTIIIVGAAIVLLVRKRP